MLRSVEKLEREQQGRKTVDSDRRELQAGICTTSEGNHSVRTPYSELRLCTEYSVVVVALFLFLLLLFFPSDVAVKVVNC